MAAGWERDGLILGLGRSWAGEPGVQGAGQETGGALGQGGCRNGGIWDVSSSSGSLGLGDRGKERQGRGNVVRRGQMLSAFLGENAGGDLGRFWLQWEPQDLASCWSVVMPGL